MKKLLTAIIATFMLGVAPMLLAPTATAANPYVHTVPTTSSAKVTKKTKKRVWVVPAVKAGNGKPGAKDGVLKVNFIKRGSKNVKAIRLAPNRKTFIITKNKKRKKATAVITVSFKAKPGSVFKSSTSKRYTIKF